MRPGDKAVRSWCAVYQWPGKKPFLVGTVVLDRDTPHHLLEAALHKLFDELWGDILPDELPRPKLVNLRPSAIFFVPEKEEP